jgi:hypothetical protein
LRAHSPLFLITRAPLVVRPSGSANSCEAILSLYDVLGRAVPSAAKSLFEDSNVAQTHFQYP